MVGTIGWAMTAASYHCSMSASVTMHRGSLRTVRNAKFFPTIRYAEKNSCSLQ